MTALKTLSKFFGILGDTRFPKFIQVRLNSAYVKHFDIDMSEYDDLQNFSSLNALFTRKLLKKRELEDGFISPCDGRVLAYGSSFSPKSDTLAFSIKQNVYNINELLGDSFSDDELENGCEYANIYLSPKNYHRYHSPYDLQVLSAHYIPANLYSVGEKALMRIQNLYAKNERVILRCKIDKKLLWLVFVGATNVGRMCFNFDESIKTNAKFALPFTKKYDNLQLIKGEEIGNFELGSTILVIAQNKLLSFKDKKEVKFGEQIATVLKN